MADTFKTRMVVCSKHEEEYRPWHDIHRHYPDVADECAVLFCQNTARYNVMATFELPKNKEEKHD